MVGAAVAVVDVIGVLPDVEGEERLQAFLHEADARLRDELAKRAAEATETTAAEDVDEDSSSSSGSSSSDSSGSGGGSGSDE